MHPWGPLAKDERGLMVNRLRSMHGMIYLVGKTFITLDYLHLFVGSLIICLSICSILYNIALVIFLLMHISNIYVN